MKLIYFVSITICSISIDTTLAQQQSFNGFPQPKAIRDNAGYFRQEIHYGSSQNQGPSGNVISQQPFEHKPILPTTVHVNPIQIPIKHMSPTPAFVPSPIKQSINVNEEQIIDTSVIRSVQNRQKVAVAIPVQAPTTVKPRTTTESLTSEELDDQAKSAYYEFGTSVHDTINDHEHVRKEVREGLALKGMYYYSDGFFRRTVHYEADEGGYRVVKEEIEPVNEGEGPKFNPKGQAEVKSSLTGDYSITVDDFRLNKKQEEQVAYQTSQE